MKFSKFISYKKICTLSIKLNIEYQKENEQRLCSNLIFTVGEIL